MSRAPSEMIGFVHYRPTGVSLRGIGCKRMALTMDAHAEAYKSHGAGYKHPCGFPKTTTDVRKVTCPDCKGLIREAVA